MTQQPITNLADEFLRSKGLKDVIDILNPPISKVDYWLNRFITVDPTMIELKNKVKLLASNNINININILIEGESGTGKELIANALHGDRKGNFVAVNCAGIPDTL